jgi:hypothetical protein
MWMASLSVEIVGGVKGVRDLIDGYALEALKEFTRNGKAWVLS